MRPVLVTRETPAELEEELAGCWRRAALASVRDRGLFAAALPGGATPEGFFRRLAREPDLPWERTHLFQTDERIVPRGSPRSNARLLYTALIGALAAAPAGVHLVEPAPADSGEAAIAYEDDLRAFLAPGGAAGGLFDLVLLGIGADGHTASLFPGSEALAEREHLAAAVPGGPGGEPRVTLTLPALDRARRVILLATGPLKREVVARLLAGADAALPAARLAPRGGPPLLFADRAAAGGGRTAGP